MKIAFLTTDGRQDQGRFEGSDLGLGKAPKALLEGFAHLAGDVEVHVISATQQPVQTPTRFADNIHFHSLVVPKWGWMRTLYQGCIRAVRRKLSEIKPDVVHGQGTERDCAISAAFSGYPNLVTIHGKMTEIEALHRASIGSYHWCAARLENFTLARCGGIIAISEYIDKRVQRYGVPVWMIPNAIQEMFFASPEAQVQAKKPTFINVGVIGQRKRQRQLLRLLCELRAEGFDFETIFVGASRSAEAVTFQNELAAANLRFGQFNHKSRLADEAFRDLFDHTSAMIHFSSEESFGLTFAEAMARNLPLFASDVGGVREMAVGVRNVEIFSVEDWAGLKGALRNWLQTYQWSKDYGHVDARPAAPPSAIVDRYHPVVVARRHLEVYRELVERARPIQPRRPVSDG